MKMMIIIMQAKDYGVDNDDGKGSAEKTFLTSTFRVSHARKRPKNKSTPL